jgi:hypothetical protein
MLLAFESRSKKKPQKTTKGKVLQIHKCPPNRKLWREMNAVNAVIRTAEVNFTLQ